MIWNIDRDWLPVLMVARNELTFNLNSYCRFCMTEAFFKFSLHQKLSVYTKGCHNRAMERNPYYRTAFCNRACSKVKEGNIYDALAGLPVLFSLSDNTYLRIISTN